MFKSTHDDNQKEGEMWAYFRIKQEGDSFHRTVQHQPSDEENNEHHIGED